MQQMSCRGPDWSQCTSTLFNPKQKIMEKRTVTIEKLSELLLVDRLLDRWKEDAKRSDYDFADGYALHDRVRAALIEQLKD